jgi:hypothetical protein
MLSVALTIASVYIASNELAKRDNEVYMSGVRDGNTQTLNSIIQQIQSTGYADIGILNGNRTATLRLVPLSANSTR